MNQLYPPTRIAAVRHIAILALLFTGATTVASADQAIPEEEANTMNMIRIRLGANTMSATLEDNAAGRDFIALLPLSVELDDYASTEKVADLPQKLSTQGAPEGFEPSVGNITYYAPWGNLAIFYRDFSFSRGLINLGRITDGVEYLNFHGPIRATIEVVED